MNGIVRLEVDIKDNGLSIPREYHGQFLRTQCCTPLLEESLEGKINPALLSRGEAQNAECWIYEPGPRWPSELPHKDGLEELARLIAQSTRQEGGSWLSSILRAVTAEKGVLVVSTRFPVASLDNVLSWTGLSVERLAGVDMRPYTLLKKPGTCGFLRPADSSCASFELVHTTDRMQGKFLFDTGQIDICWGIGVPPSFYGPDDMGPFNDSLPIPFFYTVQAGQNVPPSEFQKVFEAISSNPITVPGIEPCNTRIPTGNPLTVQQAPVVVSPEKIVHAFSRRPLFFTGFEPNEDVATQLSEIMPGGLFPIKIGYQDMVKSSSGISDGYTLSIQTARHAGWLGSFPESLYFCHPSFSPLSLYEIARELWGETRPSENALMQFEKLSDSHQRRITIGKLTSKFRSNHQVRVTPSGSIRLAEIELDYHPDNII